MPPPFKNNHTPQRGNTGSRERLRRIMLSARVKIAFPHGKHSPDRAQPLQSLAAPKAAPRIPPARGEGHDRALSQPEVKEKGFIAAVMQVSPFAPRCWKSLSRNPRTFPAERDPQGVLQQLPLSPPPSSGWDLGTRDGLEQPSSCPPRAVSELRVSCSSYQLTRGGGFLPTTRFK